MLLIVFALNADEKLFVEQLYYEHRATMWRYALSIVRNPENADDVVQKSFVKLIDKTDILQGLERQSLEAYLYITVKHTAYNLLKAHKHDIMTEPTILDTLESTQSDDYFRLWTKEELSTAVQSLAELDRDIIALRYGYDLDFASIADILNINTVNARVRLHRALTVLRRTMEERGDVHAGR